MRQPSVYALTKARIEAHLDEECPDWRERYFGDWQRAEEFYFRPKYDVISGGREQPNELVRRYEDDPDDCDCADPFCEQTGEEDGTEDSPSV